MSPSDETAAPETRRPRRDLPWRTLRGRLAIGAMAGLLAASLVFAVVASSLVSSESERNAREEFDRQVVRVAQLISNQTEARLFDGDCQERYSRQDIEAFVGRGTRLYVEGLPPCPGGIKQYADLPRAAGVVIDEALLDEQGFQRIDASTLSDVPAVATAAPLRLQGFPVSKLILVKPQEEVRSDLSDVAPRLLLATGIGFVAALVLTLLLTSRITRPIEQMRRATDRVAAGDLSTEVARHGVAELDALADDFNVMVSRLREREDASRDFLMKITHDLRTPLTAIRGHAAALSDGIVPEDLRPRSLGAIESEAGRLESMVTDLLDLARIQADRFRLTPSVTEPAAVLDLAVAALSADATARGIRVESRVGALPTILTDAARMRQIVDNLLDNAVRWSPDDGLVTLVAGPRTGGGIAVTISDMGPGVPAGSREAVFEPFTSGETPDGRTGTGLGLAICRQLARALGGDVTVADAPGGGACFTLTLPAAAPGSGSPSAAPGLIPAADPVH